MAKGHGVQVLKNIIEYEKYSFASFCYLFAGWAGKLCCTIAVVIYCYGCLWAYTAVFASSLAQLVSRYRTLFRFLYVKVFEIFSEDSCDVYSSDASSMCRASYYGAVILYCCCCLLFTIKGLLY